MDEDIVQDVDRVMRQAFGCVTATVVLALILIAGIVLINVMNIQ